MVIRIYNVEEKKVIKAYVAKCRPNSIIDTVIELIETNHNYRIKIADLKDEKRYIVNVEDLVDLMLYIDNEYKEMYVKEGE